MRKQGIDSFPGLESKRAADADEAIHGRPRQACPEMESNLVEWTQLVAVSKCSRRLGPPRLGEIACVYRRMHRTAL
jgi:hypothetical protein